MILAAIQRLVRALRALALREEMPMSRNLVVFCDGTWNSPEEERFGQPTPTNVHKLFMACADEAQSGGAQVTWYQPGVGSDGSWYRRAFEGATGTGTGLNIRRGYTAIAARYQDGDRIFLVGFSRGAFAARSIAGMIERVGLLKDPSRVAVERAYNLYRKVRSESDHRIRILRDSPDVHSRVRVHAIGVWDTVGALGLSMWGWDFNLRSIWRNSFHRLSPNSVSDHVFHALAIDEKRTSFMPLVWRDAEGQDLPGHARPLVEEAWFRGVHSDVGGGYAEAGLSDITLDWMAQRLAGVGLLLRANAPVVAPNSLGRVHNSARGPLWTNVATWPRWTPLRTIEQLESSRQRTRSYVHESVADREARAEGAGLFEQKRRWLHVGEEFQVVIRARCQWEYTGVVLEPGARYELTASGRWQDWKDTPVGPEGQPRADESWLKRLVRPLKRVPRAGWLQLIALPCHDFGWHYRELGIGRVLWYLLVADPAAFMSQYVVAGRQCVVVGPAGSEAVLWCFANDARKFYGNNTGSIVLEVRRLA